MGKKKRNVNAWSVCNGNKSMCVHVEVKRKYAYLHMESKGRVWKAVAKVPKAKVLRNPNNFSYLQNLYFTALDLW